MSNPLSAKSKLSMKTKLGYGIGQMGDSIGFNVFYFYFLFFLTDIIGLDPAVAGTISLIAVIWDAVTDPIIGHMSDTLRCKYGRRRPFMIVSMIPYAIVMYLMFSNVNMSQSAKNIYFIVVSMLFWTAYTAYVIPYFALGAELTNDYDERSSLRGWASYFMYAAVLIASAAPPMIVSMSENAGMSTEQGWRNVGIIFAVATVIVIFLCWRGTRGQEPDMDDVPVEKGSMIRTYLDMFKLKPVLPLAISVLLWSLACSMSASGLVYLMDNNLGYSAGRQSALFTFLSLIPLLWLPIITKLSEKFGKKKTYICNLVFSGLVMIVFGFVGFPAFIVLIVMVGLFEYGNSTYWTLYYSMMYDICELDEFVNGERREGAISALMSFGQKCGAALSMWVSGQLLDISGYGIAGMEESASAMVMHMNTFIPGAVGIAAAVVTLAYPLTRKKFQAISAALKNKKEGLAYSTEEFKDLL